MELVNKRRVYFLFDLYPQGMRTEAMLMTTKELNAETVLVKAVETEENVKEKENLKVKENPYVKKRFSLRQLTVIGLLAAINVALGLSGWGFIPIPPINATILHVPTLIGALLEGPKVGMLVGFIFGVYSLLQNMMVPNVMSFAFLNPLVSVLPRMLFGPIAVAIYVAMPFLKMPIRLAVATIGGAVAHTVMVMTTIYFLYAQTYAETQHIAVSKVGTILATVGVVHGIPEALVAAIITVPVVMMVRKTYKKEK